MQADDEASLATRTAKDHSLTPSLLAGRWQREAEQVGWRSGPIWTGRCAGPPLSRRRAGRRSRRPGRPGGGVVLRSARFTKADVVEHLCALSGGRLSVEEIAAMADRFVDSDLAVRLTPDTEAGRRSRRSGRPPRTGPWRTAPWP